MERVLVCVICQTRSHQLTWSGFKKNVLDELQADLALAIGIDEHYDYSNPFWQHARYRWATREFEDYGDAFDQAQRWLLKDTGIDPPDWRVLLKIKNYWLGGIRGEEAHPGGTAVPLFFRWWLHHNLIRDGVLQHYDRIIVTRSDFMWTMPHPPMSVLPAQYLWLPDGEYYWGLTDRHMVASAAHALDAINLMEDVLLRPKQLAAAMAPYSRWNMEAFLSFHLERVGLRSKVRVFPYVMFAVRGEQDATRGAVGKFNDEVGGFVKYPSEYNDARRFRTAIRITAHWEQLARLLPGLFHEVATNTDLLVEARAGAKRLTTYHETVVYLDADTDELRHARMWPHQSNVSFSLQGRRGHLHAVARDGAVRVLPPPLPDEHDAPDAGPTGVGHLLPGLEIIAHEDEGWLGFGLKSGSQFLQALPDGRVTLTPELGEWGRFKLA